jgi:VWFA-related protein
MIFSRVAAIAIVLPAIAAAAPAPLLAEPPPVRLDAIVTDTKDRPIRDLKLTDFEVTDNGQIRPVDDVTLQSRREARLIAIFLDEYHVQAGEHTQRARAALTAFVDTQLRPGDLVAIMKPLDPLNTIRTLTVAEGREQLQAQIQAFTGRKGDYAPTTPFEQNFMSRASGPAAASRTQIVSSALQSLALRIGALREGRKTLVLISEGFSSALPRGSDRLTGSVRAVVYAANRYGVAIYPIDPGLSSTEPSSEADAATLRMLADQTGGEAAFNHLDLLPALKHAVEDEDEYYVVTYRAASSGDGKFHPVEVRVKRADAQIRVRSGYWSANPELLKLAAGGAPPRANLMSMRPPHASPLIRPWVGTARGPDGLTSVTVTWDPGVAPPRNQRVGSVELKATTEDGKVIFDAPLAARATFAASPGIVHLEMTILGLDGKTLDSDYRGIQVPNLRVSRLTFASMQVMRTRSAREFTDAARNPAANPAPSREFSRAERLLLRVPVYTATDTVATVTATLLNRLGTPMRVLNPVASDLSAEIAQFDLPLSSLAPDDYRVELKANAGTEEAKALLLFRVTN